VWFVYYKLGKVIILIYLIRKLGIKKVLQTKKNCILFVNTIVAFTVC